MVELQPSKLVMRVRFPSPARSKRRRSGRYNCLYCVATAFVSAVAVVTLLMGFYGLASFSLRLSDMLTYHDIRGKATLGKKRHWCDGTFTGSQLTCLQCTF